MVRINNFARLNALVGIYRSTKDQAVFADIYEELSEERRTNTRMVKRSGLGDENDADSIFNEKLTKLLGRDDIAEFGKAFAKTLKNARLSFYRSEKRRRARYVLDANYCDNDSDEAPTSELLAADLLEARDYRSTERDLEFTACERLDKKKEDQQRQLLVSIHESARIPFDSTMVTAVEEFHKNDLRFSIEALARALGIQRNTLARKFERLARAYDRNIHGDVTEYISTYLRIKREYIAS